jgi:prepilin-type N-terminal cleavage/methylation domain-containing protein
MMPRARTTRRRGFTLIELMTSIVTASVLLAGISSSLFIAVRASDPKKTPAVSQLESSVVLADMIMDLQYAQTIASATSTGVTATVADRSGDNNPETIRYAWAGAGQPLTKQYNGGAATAVMSSVQSFNIDYYPSAAAPVYLVLTLQGTSQSSTAVETYLTLFNAL